MARYPVHFIVDKPLRYSRTQLFVRVLALIVIGLLGTSLGSLFVAAWFLLPLIAAVRLAGRDGGEYLAVDGPRIVRGLQWFAAIYAWFGLVTDRLPSRSPDETVELAIETGGQPTSGSGLMRLLLGLPSALVLGLLGLIAPFVWLWAALSVLVNERVGAGTFEFLAGIQRWAVRLLAYQASLVDDPPPFSFEDTPPAITTGRGSEPVLSTR